jgi:hypothetical protein
MFGLREFNDGEIYFLYIQSFKSHGQGGAIPAALEQRFLQHATSPQLLLDVMD